jgi:aryl-alcohol dehydrogenase-like predicted oxidoreductase
VITGSSALVSRRRVLAIGIGASALALVPRSRLVAEPRALVERTIPSSGERLPVIGIGTARRYAAITTDAERAPLTAALRRFAELGGKVIDTAPSYGTAEAVVGDSVAELGVRDGLFLATKVGASGQTAGREQIEQSFRRLRTPVIDLIAVHNLRDTETQLRMLRELKRAGRIRYVGVTTSFARQYAELEQTMRREMLDVVQVDYALDHREAGARILPLAADRGMGVMVNLPFGRGRLFKAVRGRELPPWAAEIDCASWAQLFLKYVVSHPAVTCCIPGTSRIEHLLDNLGAARGRLPDSAMRRRMETFIDTL